MIQIRFARPVLANSALVLAALAAGLTAQPALAKADEVPTAEVRVNPSLLVGNTSEIRARIAEAAARVCRAESMDLRARVAARECRNHAVRAGEAQLLALRQSALGKQQAMVTVETPKAR